MGRTCKACARRRGSRLHALRDFKIETRETTLTDKAGRLRKLQYIR